MKRINGTIQFTISEINRMTKLYKKGTGLLALAKQFNVSGPTIRTTLVNNGVTIRGRGRPVTV